MFFSGPRLDPENFGPEISSYSVIRPDDLVRNVAGQLRHFENEGAGILRPWEILGKRMIAKIDKTEKKDSLFEGGASDIAFNWGYGSFLTNVGMLYDVDGSVKVVFGSGLQDIALKNLRFVEHEKEDIIETMFLSSEDSRDWKYEHLGPKKASVKIIGENYNTGEFYVLQGKNRDEKSSLGLNLAERDKMLREGVIYLGDTIEESRDVFSGISPTTQANFFDKSKLENIVECPQNKEDVLNNELLRRIFYREEVFEDYVNMFWDDSNSMKVDIDKPRDFAYGKFFSISGKSNGRRFGATQHNSYSFVGNKRRSCYVSGKSDVASKIMKAVCEEYPFIDRDDEEVRDGIFKTLGSEIYSKDYEVGEWSDYKKKFGVEIPGSKIGDVKRRRAGKDGK